MGKGIGILTGILAVPILGAAAIAAVPQWRSTALDWISKKSDIYKTAIANNETLTAENEDLQAELDQANTDKAALQTRVTTLTNEKTSLQTQVTTLTGEKTTLQGQVTSLTNDKTTLQGQVTILTNDKANLQAQVNEKITQIATLNARIDELLAQAEENANEFKYGRYVSSIVDSNGKYTDTLIDVSDDGTGTLSYFNNEGGLDTEPFTYIVEGDNILATFNVEGETFEYELVLSGNSFDMTVEDETPMHFVECNDDLFSAISSRNMASNEVVDLSNQILSKDNEISNLNVELENKNNEISNLNNEISNLNNEISNLNAILSGKGDQIITLNEEIETLNAEIETLNARIAELESQSENLVPLNVTRRQNIEFRTSDFGYAAVIESISDNRIKTQPVSFSGTGNFYINHSSENFRIVDIDTYSYSLNGNNFSNDVWSNSVSYNASDELNPNVHIYVNGNEVTYGDLSAYGGDPDATLYATLDYTLNENNELSTYDLSIYVNGDNLQYNGAYDDPYSDPNSDPTGGEETLYGIQTDVTYKDDSSSESTIIFHSDGTFDYVRDDDTVSGTYDVMDTNYYTLYTNDNSVEFGHFTPTSENSFVLKGFTYTIV